jgi:ParB family transcriptional regulator, chromosome partitioning protein
MDKRPALGKGLSALIPDAPPPVAAGPLQVDIDLLAPNDHQPRRAFDEGPLEELAQSIQARGIIQPILVRPSGTGYRIIAGERRWRAAQRAGLMKVPVVVRDVPGDTAQQHLELALIENIQRENLNPMEESLGYQRLTEEFGMTQEQVAAAVGKDRSTVTNLLRLLRLPEEVRAELTAGTLSVGHSRALLSLPEAKDQRHVAREVISRGLSVRETEAMVKRLTAPDKSRETSAADRAPDVHTKAAEDRMRFALGAKVAIRRSGAGGTIEIAFGSEEELNRIYEIVTAKG